MKNKTAVVGYAQSPIVKQFDRPLGAVAADTVRAAIADAGLEVGDVDGFTTSTLLPAAGDHAQVDGITHASANWMAAALGVVPRYASGFQGYGQLPGAVGLGVNALISGAANCVVVYRALHNPPGRYHGSTTVEARGAQQWTMPQGFFGPIATIGLAANEYFQRYGATREDLGAVVVAARQHGARLPWSYWHDKPLSLDEYMDAPLLADPICRFDCDIPVDGVAAFVLTTAERARDLPHRPVFIRGYANSQPTRHRLPLHWPLDDIADAGAGLAAEVFARAGIGVADVDLPQLYDGFSPFVWMWMEALGMCGTGEAHTAFRDYDRAVLSGGGALGNGRMHGVPQMLECYLQLAGRAGERQRTDASVGIACHSSPHFGGAVVYSNVE